MPTAGLALVRLLEQPDFEPSGPDAARAPTERRSARGARASEHGCVLTLLAGQTVEIFAGSGRVALLVDQFLP
jgi:hypothetical protein